MLVTKIALNGLKIKSKEVNRSFDCGGSSFSIFIVWGLWCWNHYQECVLKLRNSLCGSIQSGFRLHAVSASFFIC